MISHQRVLLGMKDVLAESKPDIVLVHGDTTTSTAAALAAFYQQIPVGHIEAGLRTGDLMNPWPEELNRQITGRIASLHFAPTPLSKENLLKENIAADIIYITGNTVIDAIHYVCDKIAHNSTIAKHIEELLIAKGYNPLRNNKKCLSQDIAVKILETGSSGYAMESRNSHRSILMQILSIQCI